MMTPIRKYDGYSPKRGRRRLTRDEDPDLAMDKSFDLFDKCPSSRWYSLRIPGFLPYKRSFHASVILNNM